MNIKGKNIYTSGEYLEKNPTWGIEDSYWKAGEINRILKRNNVVPSSVAEVGCGFGQIIVSLSKMNDQILNLDGFDISPQAIRVAQRSGSDKIKFYQSNFAEENNAVYDLILIIDVLEHLNDYIDFLNKIRNKAKYFIFHIPLDLSCRTLLKPHVILQQRNDVGHLHYFSKEHAEWILKDTGFQITDWFYTFAEVDRNTPSNIKEWVKKLLRRFSYFVSKNLSTKLWGGYSIMILATNDD